MSTINQVYEFAGDATSANILSNAAYNADAGRLAGHEPGIARQDLENAVLRNLSRFNGGLAQFIAGRYAPGVVDDGDRAKIVTGMEAAINALIAEFIAAVSTPAQFDNDTSLATTAFVQRALGSRSGYLRLTDSAALTASDCGKMIVCDGTATINVTLPSLADLPLGAEIKIQSQSANPVNVLPAGADLISASNSDPNLATLNMLNGDELSLIKGSTSKWIASGTANLGRSASFGSSLAFSGYQKLPSGLIIQWGTTTISSSSADVVTTFPIAFPNAFFNTFLMVGDGQTSGAFVTLGTAITLSGFPSSVWSSSATRIAGKACFYIAFGR